MEVGWLLREHEGRRRRRSNIWLSTNAFKGRDLRDLVNGWAGLDRPSSFELYGYLWVFGYAKGTTNKKARNSDRIIFT